MRNVTLAVEEDVLVRARVRAAREGTSVNAVIRRYLAEYGAGEERLQAAMDRVLEAAERYEGRLEEGGFRREDCHGRGRRGR